MATPEEHVAQLRLDLDDPLYDGSDVDSLWKDEELYRYLDDAQNEFARRTSCLPDSSSFTSVVTAEDPWVLIDAKITDIRVGYLQILGSDLHPVTMGEMTHMSRGDDYGVTNSINWRTRKGKPLYVVTDMEHGKGRLVSIPTADDVIEWTCYRLPIEPIEDDLSEYEIDEVFHDALMSKAKSSAYRKHDSETKDTGLADEWERDWEEAINNATSFYKKKRRGATLVKYGGY